ncbi:MULTISPECIES: hypothetical protein [Cyanophyceae]|nr:hypothetical protein [Trichocoleus sp. FACHB-40]MBD2003275.1 hypothetical protein [Trichocoleus sp. FACHB-40]
MVLPTPSSCNASKVPLLLRLANATQYRPCGVSSDRSFEQRQDVIAVLY